MSGPWHPTGRARVRARSPQAQGVCDRCGMTFTHSDLRWQFQWAGVQLQNLQILVCHKCLDVPQIQLRTIILPPDPVPIMNPRPEQYQVESPSYVQTLTGVPFTLMSGDYNLCSMMQVVPNPQPAPPVFGPPAFEP